MDSEQVGVWFWLGSNFNIIIEGIKKLGSYMNLRWRLILACNGIGSLERVQNHHVSSLDSFPTLGLCISMW